MPRTIQSVEVALFTRLADDLLSDSWYRRHAMQISVLTALYSRHHGKAPKGTKTYRFCFNGRDSRPFEIEGLPFFKARRVARALAGRRKNEGVTAVILLP